MSWIDKRDEPQLLAEVEQNIKRKKQTNPNTALVGERLAGIYRRHPYIPTGVALSLAEANADVATVDAVAMSSAMNKMVKLADEQMQPRKDDSWKDPKTWDPNAGFGWDDVVKPVGWLLGKTVGSIAPLKTASRYTFAALESGPQHIANYLSRVTDPNRPTSDVTDASVSTSIGALLKWPELQGDGFFIDEELQEKRTEAVRRYRWQLANGDSYTPGRGGAQMVFTPGSAPYSLVSGIIDAAVAWKADPTGAPLDEVAKYNKARKIIPAVETVDEVDAARKLAKLEAGVLSTAEEHAIDTSKFFNWLDNTSIGRRVVDRTAEETNELRIMEAYNYRISPDTARRLARTTDRDEIRGILGDAATRLKTETEAGAVQFATSAEQLPIASVWNAAVENIPGYRAIKESRLFSKVPKGQLVVNGTPQQKAEGLKNIKNWLTLLKIDPYSGDGQNLMEQAFTWAGADGTRVDANKMVDLFLGNKSRKITGVLPTALLAENVPVEQIDELMETLRGSEKLLRQYGTDAAGVADDKGMFLHLAQHMRDNELAVLLEELFPKLDVGSMNKQDMLNYVSSLEPGRIILNGPQTLAQMLNNVVVLPDPRTIRKITSNPFFDLRYDKTVARKSQQARTSQLLETIQNDVWRPWALATFGFVMRNTFDAQTRVAMSGIMRGNPLDYLLIALNKRGIGTIGGQAWRSAEDVPVGLVRSIVYGRLGDGRPIRDPNIIQELLDPYVGQLSDDVMGDLLQANKPEDVMKVLARVQPADDILEEYADFSQGFSRRMVEDPRNQLERLVETDQVKAIDPSQPAFRQAMIDNAGLLYGDPFARLSARIMHLSDDAQKRVVVDWLQSGTRDSQNARRQIVDYLTAPTVARRTDGMNRTVASAVDVAKMTDEQLVELWYETGARTAVEEYTRRSDELRTFVGYNSVPVAPAQLVDEDTVKALNNGQPPKPGDVLLETYDEVIERGGEEIVRERTRQHLVLERERIPKTKPPQFRYKTIEVKDVGTAFGRTKAGETVQSKSAEQFIDQLVTASRQAQDQGLNPLVPDRALVRVRETEKAWSDTVKNLVTAPARGFFKYVVGPYTKALERSPAFRKMYYNVIEDNAKLLYPPEARRVLDTIRDEAEKAFPQAFERDPEAAMRYYVGGKTVLDALEAAAKGGPTAGIGTAQQLQDYAMAIAKYDSEELFFNNVERSNFTDAMRVVAPFGAAWAEIAGTYGKALVQNPARLRKATLVYRGAEQYDPDNDGRGMIWTDPQSGNQMFAFPLSGTVTKALTALTGKPVEETFLAAPTRRLSAGFSLIPSLGPVYSVLASEIFNRTNIPATSDFRKMLLPYGDAGIEGLVPGALAKFLQGLDADPSNLNNVYGNTYQDMFAYLSTTGEYDLTDSSDVARLDEDSRQAARGMTFVRAISQFVGPTSASPQYRFRNEAGEFYFVNEMVRVFSDLQAENYDTAVAEFTKRFGTQALIYLSGKTKVDPAYKGVEANEEYGRWEQENRELIRTFKDTAPFLAPGAFGEFSPEVYSKQVAAGMRKDRDNQDRLADAQRRMGSALYKHIRNQFPEVLSDTQRERLRRYRTQIHEQYPGFPKNVEFKVGEFENFVDRLGKLVQDPRTQGNPVRDAIWDYLKYRANTISSLERQYGVSLNAEKSEGARNARGLLYAKGEELATVVPDFRRIWEQELSSELE